MADKSLKSLHPFLVENTTDTSAGCTVKSFSHEHASGSGVILIMIHGWPQSSYMYRHVVGQLKDKVSMFIPELPGYGFSSRPPADDKRTVGSILLEACAAVMHDYASRPVIWCSHDRGARVGHRMLVDASHPPSKPAPSPGCNANQALLKNIKAGILMDIVPTTVQWAAFAAPRNSVAYFHWPFLALPNAAEFMTAMGGDLYTERCLNRTMSANPQGAQRIAADDAIAHYCAQFARRETIEGSCADYKSGAEEDCAEQEADQKAGRKVKLPLMVIYSAANLGRMHNVDAVWNEWCDGEYRGEGIEDGHGHYLPESCPDEVVKSILEWVDTYGK